MSIKTIYSELLISCTFGSDYSLESSWVWPDEPCTSGFRDFLLFLSRDPLNHCQVGWGPSVDRHFQVCLCLGSLSCWKVEVSALDQVFIEDVSVLCSVQLSPQPWPVSQSLLLKTHWDGTGQVMCGVWFPPDLMPWIWGQTAPPCFYLTRESCFSQSATKHIKTQLQAAFICFLLRWSFYLINLP